MRISQKLKLTGILFCAVLLVGCGTNTTVSQMADSPSPTADTSTMDAQTDAAQTGAADDTSSTGHPDPSKSVAEQIQEFIDNNYTAPTEKESYTPDPNADSKNYIQAVKWLLNPNAGPVYWQNTYDQYADYIDPSLLERKIQEYRANGGVDVSSLGMDEPEYHMINTCRYPIFTLDYGCMTPNDKSSYELSDSETQTYAEFLAQFEAQKGNPDSYFFQPSFNICQDRCYIYCYDLNDNEQEVLSRLKEEFYKPLWSIEFDYAEGNHIYLRDIGLYDRDIYIGETIYTLTLNDHNKVVDIDTFSCRNAGIKYFKNDYIPDTWTSTLEYYKKEDEEYYEVFGSYPNDDDIPNRLIADDEIIQKYHLDKLKMALLEDARYYLNHPVLSLYKDYGNFVQLNISDPFLDAVADAVYDGYVGCYEDDVFVHIDGRYKTVCTPSLSTITEETVFD